MSPPRHPPRTQDESTHLVPEHIYVLLVARRLVRPIVYERAERPQAERRLAVFAHEVEVGPVRAPAHLARFGDDRVDALGEDVVQ
jgi:hypothetical protein